uniref:Ig-like domain-containing protein n=1 Tax=Salarias fasciatus TaxID=181472 RepID=A0A672FF92_SALFA
RMFCSLLLTVVDAGHSQLGPFGLRPVLATLGADVVLSCQLEPAADVTESTMEWSRSDLSPRFVHLRRDGMEFLVNQHPLYVGRTYLSPGRLKQGDLSLRLSSVRLSDQGTYRCDSGFRDDQSLLNQRTDSVCAPPAGGAPATVAVSAEAGQSRGGVLLGCESAGWYPEPELLWLDAEGKPVSAGPSQTHRGPDGLYAISSRVTVEKRTSNTLSCRVQQSNISQSRTAEFSFKGEAASRQLGDHLETIFCSSVSFQWRSRRIRPARLLGSLPSWSWLLPSSFGFHVSSAGGS